MGTQLRAGAVALAVLATPLPAAASEQLLNPMFSDHAVLQRGQPIRIYGNAKPGSSVRVTFADAKLAATADASGRWEATFPAMQAGGPYVIKASSGWLGSTKAKDVLIGDVWLCSGQSNMQFTVDGSLSAKSEVQNSANDKIRMLKIDDAASAVPLTQFTTAPKWLVASPKNTGSFSAVCYYFARELQKTVNVPMGLVNASWGGSRIETWISAAGLHAAGGHEERLEILKLSTTEETAAARKWGALWEDWWKKTPGATGEPWKDASGAGWKPVPKIDFWDNWGDPDFSNYTGTAWYRTGLNLTAAQAAQAASLDIGHADEVDQTWVNGISVGGGSGGERTYNLPAGTLHEGANTITVNVLNTWAFGGLTGPASVQAVRFADGSKVPLAGPWQYKKDVPAAVSTPPRAPWDPIAGDSMAYNAMIAPIGPFGFHGALWYQGESNTHGSDPAAYSGLLAGLMADWRGRYGKDLPFLIVQLPNFGAQPTEPAESGWADLREAQREAVAADPRAGLAVTIDVGDRDNLHPPNKQAVGVRLARAARHVAYGENVAPSGPTATDAMRTKTGIVIRFKDVAGGLLAYGSNQILGFEVCAADAASCRYTPALVDGEEVAVADSSKTATRVRYCWADNPVCTLYDKTNLPVGPFELPVH